MEQTESKALRICAAFERCMNYPKDEDGIGALARGLLRSSTETGVLMQDIAEECLRVSTWCPTDADLLAVARDLRGPAQVPAVTQTSRKCPYGKCDGAGWIRGYALYTYAGDGYSYVKKQWITEAQYNDLASKIDWNKQRVYDGVKPCACHPATKDAA